MAIVLLLPACSVNVKKEKDGDDKQVDIQTPVGGIHVSILPDEAAKHADAIVIGMAEQTWPRLLRDFKAGRMAAVYREESPEGDVAAGIPTPRYDALRVKHAFLGSGLSGNCTCRPATDDEHVILIFH